MDVASRRWVEVTVRVREPGPVTFTITPAATASPLLTWRHRVDGVFRFRWRGRTLEGGAVPLGDYRLEISGAGVDRAVPVRVTSVEGTAAAQPPAAPAPPRVVVAETNRLAWDEASAGDVLFYRVYRAESPGGAFRQVGVTSVPEFRDRPEHPGTFWYRVAAVAVGGVEGPPSNEAPADRVSMAKVVGSEGGSLAPATGSIRLEIPPGALLGPTIITIDQVASPPGAGVNRVLASPAFELGPSGLTFVTPARLVLSYRPPDGHVLPTSYPADTTTVDFWDEPADSWQSLPGPTVGASTVDVALPHFSLLVAASLTDPHGGYSSASAACGYCHQSHRAPGPHLFARATEKETCYQCHDGTGATADIRSAFGEEAIGSSTLSSFHPVPQSRNGYVLACTDCHTPHNLAADFPALLHTGRSTESASWQYNATSTPLGNSFCWSCHTDTAPAPVANFPGQLGPGGTQAPGRYDGGVHQLLLDAATYPAMAATGNQCVLCHDPHGSSGPSLSRQEDTCYGCHNADTPNTNPDEPFVATEIHYAFTAAANVYAPSGSTRLTLYHHPVGDADQADGRKVECASCHNAHLADRDASGTTKTKVIDPADTTTEFFLQWSSANNWDGPMDGAPSTPPDLFCLRCHVDRSTTAPISKSGTVAYDVRLIDDGAAHDSFDAAALTADEHTSKLYCTACHDPHGSSNAFLLKEYPRPFRGGAGPGPITGIPNLSGSWPTADWYRIYDFCTTCHDGDGARDPATHHSAHEDGTLGPGTPCTQCHRHGERF